MWAYCKFINVPWYNINVKWDQYNILQMKLSNLQLKKLKSPATNDSKVSVKLLSNVIRDSNDETNFPQKLLLTEKQVSKLHKSFMNN